MGRHREFDIEDVLQKAMMVFWRRGFAGTSMADIYEATGLKPGSIYGAFTDKDTLFRRVFEHYAAHFRATLPTETEGLPAIQAWLKLQAKLATEDPARAGCLIVNTLMEREAHAPATQALALGRMQEIRDFFMRHLTVAMARGALVPTADIAAYADALLGTVVSIMGLGRAGADGRSIHNIADLAFAALPSQVDQTIKNKS